MKKYIVRDNDTMWSVSKATGVRVNLLMAANPQIHDPNHLRPGSVIVIPELHKGNTHGDLEPDVSGPAQPEVPIAPSSMAPTPTSTPAPAPVSAPTPPLPPVPTTQPMAPYFGFVWPHVVKPGETWEDIGKQYQLDVSRLKQMNPSHADAALREGDILYIPGGQGTGVMPPVHELGPHTHHPYRKPNHSIPATTYYPSVAPARVPPVPSGGMWAFVPAMPMGYVPARIPLYPPLQMNPYHAAPSTWYDDWGESSWWASDWSPSSTYPARVKTESDSFPGGTDPKWFGEPRDGTSQG